MSYRRKKTRREKEDMSREVIRHGSGSDDVEHRYTKNFKISSKGDKKGVLSRIVI